MTEQAGMLRAARALVLGLGALALLFVLGRPLVHYAAVVACGILLSVALSSLAGALSRHTRIPHRLAVAVVVLGIVGTLVGLIAWTGPRIVEQASELDDAMRRGLASARAWLMGSGTGRAIAERLAVVREQIGDSSGDMLGPVARGVRSGFEAFADAMIVIFLGIFVALRPGEYLEGVLLLVPRERRPRLREVARETARTLRAWLGARLTLMIVIGTAFGTALAILGLPLALPIGVLTGMLAFIPFVGAIVALVPALAVAFLEGPEKALQVLLVYLVIQMVETYVLDPLVESRAVNLAPPLVLLAQVVAVVWFGGLGVVFATPLLVVVVVAVRMLYLEDRLGEAPRTPHHDRAPAFFAFLRRRPRDAAA